MNRRRFLQAGAAALAAHALTPDHLRAAEGRAQRVGLIGCGWYGKVNLFRLLQVAPVEVVSLCDVDSRMLAETSARLAGRAGQKPPRLYRDYREMLREKDLDLVLVATPDHWHALPTIAALQAGADVYCEKPTSVDVVESQAMLAAARKYGRVVQVNTQRRSTAHLLEAKRDFVQAGRLGTIAHVEIHSFYSKRDENPPETAPPAELDYDFWAGPAPRRPYTSLLHPREWRSFTEYGNGIIGDLGVHMLDLTRWMLGLGWPLRVSSSGGLLVRQSSQANIPDTQTALFEYPNLQVVWNHRIWGEAPDPAYPWAAIFYGDKGTLKCSVNSYDFIPTDKSRKPIHREAVTELDQFPDDRTEKDLEPNIAPAIRAHLRDFLGAVARRSRPVADLEEGVTSSVSCILANLALQLGRTLEWDAEAGSVRDDDQANGLLSRPYREPWVHPTPGEL